MGDVGVDVERTVGGREFVEAQGAQAVEEQSAVGAVAVEQRFGLSHRLRRERRYGSQLGEHRWADGEVAGQAVDRAAQFLRYQQPAQAPARHRKILRKAVDHNRFPRRLPRATRRRRTVVHEAVIDLVADQAHPVRVTPRCDRGELLRGNDRAGRIGGTGHDDTRHRWIDGSQHLDRGLEPGLGTTGQLDHVTSEGGENVAVTRVSGAGDGHPVTDVEASQERQQETTRRTGGDDDIIGVDGKPVPSVVGLGDRGAQFGDAQRHRIAELVAGQRRDGGLAHR